MLRRIFLYCILSVIVINAFVGLYYPPIWWSMLFFGPIIIIGLADMLQTKKAVRRNFPILGNFRYLMEEIRPEIQQYFVESNSSGTPFSREDRSVVYQRAKNVRDTVAFGTQKVLYATGAEWVNHSMAPKDVNPKDMRTIVGGPACQKPYNASLLNIGAMSYGALSKNAILALSQGAKIGNFAHNTGEGGVSPYHLKGGGDLIWQIGTGYFGCRTKEGRFCEKSYVEKTSLENIKMIELKISQGAKPGKGGILPASKVTNEIAEIRGVDLGHDVISPPAHREFDSPEGLLRFIQKLRELSNGKPVGFKMCLGKRREFLSICKAMLKTGIMPDFISVDGAEGGTGAAPLEFTNYVGCPLTEAVVFVHNSLVGCGLREDIKIFASGKVTSGFGMTHKLAIGADVVYSARGMMLALGCIQALKCNANSCPTGVATQDPGLVVGLVVADKNKRVAHYHENTIKSLAQIVGTMGLYHPTDLKPWHIIRRVDTTRIQHYGEIHSFLKPGDLLKEPLPEHFARAWNTASEKSFAHDSSFQE